MRSRGVKTNGIGQRTQAHLNLKVSLADLAHREKVLRAVPAYPNRFASTSRVQIAAEVTHDQ